MQSQYNLRSPAVKRLMREAQELSEPTEQYHAQPLEDNLFEWHFTIRGPADTEFEGGIYHGRIILPADYPMKPPSIILLTPNGRFEVFKKICLSLSGHHPESWQPSWSIRTALLAIIGFMPTHGNGAIGSLDYSADERKVLARRTKDYKCDQCGKTKNILKPVTEASEKTKQEAQELAKQISFQGEKEKKASQSSESKDSSLPTETAQGDTSATQNPTQQMQPRFPMFPQMGFPPFPPGMFRPPTTTTGPGMMMPPFWPGMIPPGHQSNRQQSPMPPFFLPGFIMPPPFGNMPQSPSYTAGSSTTSQQDVNLNTSSAQSSDSLRRETQSETGTSASLGGSASASSSSNETKPDAQQTDPKPSQTQPSVPSVDSVDSHTQLRQRNVAPGESGSQPEGATSSAHAHRSTSPPVAQVASTQRVAGRAGQGVARNTATARNNRSGDLFHQCTVIAMVLIVIALVVLVIRRLVIMNVISFD